MTILIIGIGNEYRKDDGVGRVIAQELTRSTLPSGTSIVEVNGEGAALMETWEGADAVILIDAVSSGAAPGTVHRLNAHRQPIPSQFLNCSTHAFGVAEAIEMARVLNRLPPRVVLYGIEAETFEPGAGLSASVRKAIPEVLKSVTREAQALANGVYES